jgi:hypothetical protein
MKMLLPQHRDIRRLTLLEAAMLHELTLSRSQLILPGQFLLMVTHKTSTRVPLLRD